MTDRGPIREKLRELAGREALSPSELSALRRQLKSKPTPIAIFEKHRFALAAGLAVLGIFCLWSWWLIRADEPALLNPNVDLIVEEVSTNHLKMKSLDVTTSAMNELQNRMEQLDFAPKWPTRIASNNYRLVGARYCTLQGKLAAQIFLRSSDNIHVTLYQAGYSREKFGALPDMTKKEAPVVRQQNGVSVHLWVESGLLMAMASSEPITPARTDMVSMVALQ
jgi:hypothetical protein